MSKAENLEGQKFGKLTAIKIAYRKNNKIFWECQCDCGNKVAVYSSHLKSGNSKSCGCMRGKKSMEVGSKKGKGVHGVYYFGQKEIKLKHKYKPEGNKRGGEVKCIKLSKEEMEEYIKNLKFKEVQHRKN